METSSLSLAIIGGGAAGIFAAISARAAHPSAQVILLEKTAVLLAKVRISGGGRCNVTHSCFEPKQLIKNYPRGEKELLGPFHRFQPSDTIAWFELRGVTLKTESDGRIFPITDQSETIISCLLQEAKNLGVEIRLRQQIKSIVKDERGFQITLENEQLQSRGLLLATGSSPVGYQWAENFGHTLQKPVPSLFTFNAPTSPLKELSGISVDSVELKIADSSYSQKGPLLITHFGFSGPAALKLSAWAARLCHEKQYRFTLLVNWLPSLSEEAIYQKLLDFKSRFPQRNIFSENPFHLPKNLWIKLFKHSIRSGDIPNKDLLTAAQKLHADPYLVDGKTTHKEEFVTCGGVLLKEVDFKTMQSKVCPGLYFAGEILDIDGVTGGFNFQNAWSTGFIAGISALC